MCASTKLPEERILKIDQVHVIGHKIPAEGRNIRSVAREMVVVRRDTIKKCLRLSKTLRGGAPEEAFVGLVEMVAPVPSAHPE
jgi:hypothetical protein